MWTSTKAIQHGAMAPPPWQLRSRANEHCTACSRQPSLTTEVVQPPLRCQAAAQRPVRCQAAATESAPFPLPEAVVEQPELDSNVRWLDLAQPVDEDMVDRLAEGFVQQPMQTRKTQAGPNAETGIDDWEAIEVIGMGSWRLADRVSQPIDALVAHVEGMWRHQLPMDLRLYPLAEPYKYMDSCNMTEDHSSTSYAEVPDPKKGEEGWPRLLLENRCYQSDVFRKLHLELAVRQDGLEVIHCVMYPRGDVDLPIVAFDMVGRAGAVVFCCVDASPVSMTRKLPPLYEKMLTDLQEQFELTNNRNMPDWGREIFSDQCVLMMPKSGRDVEAFVTYVIGLVHQHLRLAWHIKPLDGPDREARMEDVAAAHKRYADQQLKNGKTKTVLAAAFGEGIAEEYMHAVMFDKLPEGAVESWAFDDEPEESAHDETEVDGDQEVAASNDEEDESASAAS